MLLTPTNRPCLLRHASVIAHYHTPKMVSRSEIFRTPKSGKVMHLYKYKMHTHNTPEYLEKCSTEGILKRQGLHQRKIECSPLSFGSMLKVSVILYIYFFFVTLFQISFENKFTMMTPPFTQLQPPSPPPHIILLTLVLNWSMNFDVV